MTQNINNLVKPTPLPDVMGERAQQFDTQVAQANKEYADAEEANRRAAQVAQPVAVYTAPAPSYSGSHEDWMARAGISSSDYGYVDYIVSRESGWNYDATNASSGAHGLPQALPYSKTGCGWDDPICQLSWANGYAKASYGSWYGAYVFWVNNHWW